MAKQLRIQLRKNGSVEAETLGMHGQECLDYIDILEELLEADVVTSSYTEDYQRSATSATAADTIDVGTADS